MAIKQYHVAVFAEVNTETGKILRVAADPDAMAGGGGDDTVFNVSTDEWEEEDWEDGHSQNAFDTILKVLSVGGKEVLDVGR